MHPSQETFYLMRSENSITDKNFDVNTSREDDLLDIFYKHLKGVTT